MKAIWTSIITLVITLHLLTANAHGQPLATCADLELSNGIFTPAWRAYYGRWKEDLSTCEPVYTSFFTGFVSGRHQIRKPSDGIVPCFGNNTIPYVPPGYKNAIQLGNWDDNKEWERLATTIKVTEDNSMIEVNLSIFLEDPDHDVCRQPRFLIRVYDDKQNLIPCGDYQVIAASSLPGWGTSKCKSYKPVKFLPWTKMSIDLRKYLGKNITLEFQTMDCSEGGHSGFALFALRCLKSEITATPFCPQQSNSITLTAPDGFASYLWSNGSKDKSITVTNPQPGKKYMVQLSPYSILNGSCQISMEYTVPPIPELFLPADTVFCENSSVTINAQTSVGGYNFTWNTGQTGAAIQVNTPGAYVVTANNGVCTLKDTVTVQQSPLPVFQTQVTDAVCFGAPGQAVVFPADPNTNYGYHWSSGQTGPEQMLPAGTYTVTVVTANGCRQTAVLQIEQPGQPLFYTTPDTFKCKEAAIPLRAAGDFVSYQWSGGAQGDVILVDSAGTYTVTATDAGGCTMAKSITVNDHPSPAVSITSEDYTLCPGATTGITVVVTQASAAGFQWDGTHLTGGSGVVGAGVYTVTVTDTNGCTGSATVSIEEVPPYHVSLIGPAFICDGGTASIQLRIQPGAAEGTAWVSGTSGLSGQFVFSQGEGVWMVSPAQTDTFRLDSLVVPGYDCPFSGLPAKVAIAVDKLSASIVPELKANGLPLLCAGNSDVKLFAGVENGQPPYSYTWSPVASNESVVSSLSAGNYTLTVAGANGCTSVAQISVTAPERVEAAIHATAPVCFGENNGVLSFQPVSGQAPLFAEINANDPLAIPGTLTGLKPGVYNIHISDGFCPFDTVVVFPGLPYYFIELQDTLVGLELPTAYKLQTISNAPLESVTYSPGHIMSDSATLRPIATPLKDTWVTVQAFTDKGCLLTDQMRFKVKNSGLIYVPNSIMAGDDGENATFYISAREGVVRNLSLHIFDRQGSMVYRNQNLQPNDPKNGWNGSCRGRIVDEGVFTWTLEITYVDDTVEFRNGDVTVFRAR